MSECELLGPELSRLGIVSHWLSIVAVAIAPGVGRFLSSAVSANRSAHRRPGWPAQ